ncbi:MAG: Eco57I restriction-modification methylase domain-containing protein [Gammaproteobacteria bacterium]|nr:Eco57I restriction-modification methylase domain-containing protein [Gammaproteobacteria bacterium]
MKPQTITARPLCADLPANKAPIPSSELCPVAQAVQALASSSNAEQRGAVYTRREVVEFILDLCGYVTNQPLHKLKLLEPSFGDGDFLLPAVARLVKAWQNTGDAGDPTTALAGAVGAVELHRATFENTKSRLVTQLYDCGLSRPQATRLADAWLLNADFLLTPLPGSFDVVIGNPPYVRQEKIPSALLAEYRTRYTTIYDRADLYIPFFERSLKALSNRGALGFICANRWMKNRYGGPLRQLIAKQFHLRFYIDMAGTPAFNSDVIAYPAITVVAQGCSELTRIAQCPTIEDKSLRTLARTLTSSRYPDVASGVSVLKRVTRAAEPWILDASNRLAVLRRLENSFPQLEETGCKVGIGVATGADKAFIGQMAELDVETDRKLPLLMTKDIANGTVNWRGLGVINPFDAKGSLVDLADYPKLRNYLQARKKQIAARHCARRSPAGWYRTIDRIIPGLAATPKLLIPDIKGYAHIVCDDGHYYPHHNLYYITSQHWELPALQAVLLSHVTRLFIAAYTTKMNGGYLRFQAQYLRRLRLPSWKSVPNNIRLSLTQAGTRRDRHACDAAVSALYELDHAENSALSAMGN